MIANAPRLLISAAGTGVGWAYALTLAQQFPQVELITADSNARPWVSAAQFAHAHIQWPLFSAEPAYLQRLNALIREQRISYYLPIIDPEIQFAAEHAAQIEARLIAPTAAFTQLATAKQDYAERLGALGIDSPALLQASDIDAGRAAFAKLPAGFGGRAVWPVRQPQDLRDLPEDCFLQEALNGAEYTADCMPTGDADIVFCSVRERLETKSGVCTKARIAPHPVMECYARELVRHFDLRSPFCFQAIAQGERLAVTDINPRLGAGTMMSAANGSDFFGAHLAQIFGGDWRSRLQRRLTRCAVTRQYIELLSAEA